VGNSKFEIRNSKYDFLAVAWLEAHGHVGYPCLRHIGGFMAAEIFTDAWAQLWNDKINANTDYKKAAEKWEGAIAMVMKPDPTMGIPEERIVIADLWHGDCRNAQVGNSDELEEAPYHIEAEPAAWKSVLAGKTDPIVGLMGGKLKLAKGSLFALLPYAKAAKELVRSAIEVDTSFPDGWD
jgi:putative sterol carrier protein